MKKKYLFIASLITSIGLHAGQIDGNAVLGSALGAAAGSALGSAAGGKEGAIIGGGAGGAIGAAIGSSKSNTGVATQAHIGYSGDRRDYDDRDGHHDNGKHKGHYKQKHKNHH